MEHRRVADREMAPVVASEGTSRTEARSERGGSHRGENGRGDIEKIIPDVRASDIEPYTGLRYLSRLFKLMGVILALLLVAEIITGLSTQGSAAIPTLLGEASRLLVFAGLLWGSGDLAHLLIDIGHDVRAARILMTRQVHHTVGPKAARNLSTPSVAGSTTAGAADIAESRFDTRPPDSTR